MPFDIPPASLKTDCLICPVQSCLAHRGPGDQAAAWSSMLAPRMPVMPGVSNLFRRGDRLRSLYSVRGGCIKTYTVDAHGGERIRGFYLPGDIVGFDALGDGICLSTAVAVVPSQVCVAPVIELRQLMLKLPEIGQRLIQQQSRELAMALAISGDYSAEQRLAAFLLNMRARTGAAQVLRLPMAQRDIGNYLRLANETVCRTLKNFERKGWLAPVSERGLRLLDEASLREAAEAVGIADALPSMRQAA